MRYIGSKGLLLESIEKVIKQHTKGTEESFCDIFSGTGTVARYFKPMYQIYSNDSLHFSYVIQKATIENNHRPAFEKLARVGISDPFEYLEETAIRDVILTDEDFFIAKNYAPNEGCNRMYLTAPNALRVDFIRTTIEKWSIQGLIDETEYYYLLAGLIEGVPYVSNITGTYGAYLKKWDRRAQKELEMIRLEVHDNERKNYCFNEDANQLIDRIEGDILYLDPPYNTRQYAPNYHLLETISKYDQPEIKGITGMRPYEEIKSPFCIRGKVLDAFEELMEKARFENIIMSYSTEGLMNAKEISQIMLRHGNPDTFHMYSIPYRKYKAKEDQKIRTLSEYLFFIKKDFTKPIVVDLMPSGDRQVKIEQLYDDFPSRANLKAGKTAEPTQEMQTKVSRRRQKPAGSKKYLKSPLNYIGGKYKLLPQIMPLFPKDIRNFVDLFSGGCNVSVNAVAQHIICNDINSKIIELFEDFRNTPLETILTKIDQNIEQYGLSKTNEEGFRKFRDHYNQTKDPIDLYTLTCYSFNYQFRFNNQLEYNNPFGRDRSQFSDCMRRHLCEFVTHLQELDMEFRVGDFSEMPLEGLGPQDFIYADPPYFITTGSYNDGKRGFRDWKAQEERKLYDYLDQADAKGIRFALSNVCEHKGRHNEILEEWSKKYRVIDLNFTYSNASYNTSRVGSKEVLVVNY